jgi:spoIIIJ-associated protein
MTALREFKGNSLDEALEAASSALGIPVDDLQYEMVEQGRRGVFGLGARQVRVRVELDAEELVTPEPVVAQPAPPARQPRPPRSPRPARSGRSTKPARSGKPRREKKKEESSPDGDAVGQTLERMLDLMGLQLRAQASASGSNVKVLLSGKDRRALLQKDGQLLAALNFLLNRMSRRAWPEVGRIQVQCDGHRNRRDDDVVELVKEVASQVQRTGEAKELHPMNPYERRLAHITVRDYEDLASHSVGDAFLKTIIIEKR